VHRSRECTQPYLSTGISNLLQLAQAEVMLGKHCTVYIKPLGIQRNMRWSWFSDEITWQYRDKKNMGKILVDLGLPIEGGGGEGECPRECASMK
jgi:hypothetical protein